MLTFEEARQFISSALPYGIKTGLERIERLLAEVGNPEQGLKAIHIAGTNGKGSTSALMMHILASADYRVGWFTSPFLERFNERMRIIDGKSGLAQFEVNPIGAEIPEEVFARHITTLKQVCERIVRGGGEHPTEFELITAAGFMWFAEANVDIVVLEVGMGGRLDSTNVIQNPLATVITALGYDHMDYLGDTIKSISAEKAGIFKANCPVVLYDPSDCFLTDEEALEAFNVIQAKATAKGAPLTLVSASRVKILDTTVAGTRFVDVLDNKEYQITQLGSYQPQLALLAKTALKELVDEDAVACGIKKMKWPGRFEVTGQRPITILDGAHNPQGCRALIQTLDSLFPKEKLSFVIGALADKSYRAMVQTIASSSLNPQTITVTQPDSFRGLEAKALAKATIEAYETVGKQMPQIAIEANAIKAVKQASHQCLKSNQILVIFGSLYLAGEVRQTLLHINETTKE